MAGTGGRTLKEHIKLIFEKIITDELAIGFTYTGRGKGEKNSFKIYKNIEHCIICEYITVNEAKITEFHKGK